LRAKFHFTFMDVTESSYPWFRPLGKVAKRSLHVASKKKDFGKCVERAARGAYRGAEQARRGRRQLQEGGNGREAAGSRI
jgi:hypothetical protein